MITWSAIFQVSINMIPANNKSLLVGKEGKVSVDFGYAGLNIHFTALG